MKGVDREVRSRINKATTGEMGTVWKSVVQANATRALDTRVLVPGTRVASGNPPSGVAATSKRKIGGRMAPADVWAGVEFGANRESYSRYSRKSKNGKVHTVERRTMRHLPPRNRKGRVVFAALGDVGPRLASMWVQIIVKTIYDASEGKR